ncbi:MAG: hypothetical protein R2685_10845 [Candidatus Nitrosocosmicus sp.]|nr:hypothetical protein [Candidatus Nitrosocosmicus sp.]
MGFGHSKIIYFLLIFINLSFLVSDASQYVNPFNNPFSDITNPFVDYTNLFTDVLTYILTGLLAFVAVKISQWVSNNSKWKGDREKFEAKQVNTNETMANAIKLLVDDLKATKEKWNSEMKELEGDFQGLNNKTIAHEERISNLKDQIDRRGKR